MIDNLVIMTDNLIDWLNTPIGDLLPGVRYTRNGGMRFLRVGRVQLSFCLCRQSI